MQACRDCFEDSGQPSQTEYSMVLSQHILQPGFLKCQSDSWNSLPNLLHDLAVESESFGRDLKMHLFAGH